MVPGSRTTARSRPFHLRRCPRPPPSRRRRRCRSGTSRCRRCARSASCSGRRGRRRARAGPCRRPRSPRRARRRADCSGCRRRRRPRSRSVQHDEASLLAVLRAAGEPAGFEDPADRVLRAAGGRRTRAPRAWRRRRGKHPCGAGYGAGSESTASPIVAVASGVACVHARARYPGDGQRRVDRASRAANVPVPSTVESETKRTPRSLILAGGGELAAAQAGAARRASSRRGGSSRPRRPGRRRWPRGGPSRRGRVRRRASPARGRQRQRVVRRVQRGDRAPRRPRPERRAGTSGSPARAAHALDEVGVALGRDVDRVAQRDDLDVPHRVAARTRARRRAASASRGRRRRSGSAPRRPARRPATRGGRLRGAGQSRQTS